MPGKQESLTSEPLSCCLDDGGAKKKKRNAEVGHVVHNDVGILQHIITTQISEVCLVWSRAEVFSHGSSKATVLQVLETSLLQHRLQKPLDPWSMK